MLQYQYLFVALQASMTLLAGHSLSLRKSVSSALEVGLRGQGDMGGCAEVDSQGGGGLGGYVRGCVCGLGAGLQEGLG